MVSVVALTGVELLGMACLHCTEYTNTGVTSVPVSSAPLQDLGIALRRCIALDLQPLSASALTASPRAQLPLDTDPRDANALAALLARQGAALVEALETAMVSGGVGGDHRLDLPDHVRHLRLPLAPSPPPSTRFATCVQLAQL